MRPIILLLLLCTLIGCRKPLVEDSPTVSPLQHAELGFELEEPTVILNELAKGTLDRYVYSVLQQTFDPALPTPAEKHWEFRYLALTNKITQMVHHLPHYALCEKEVYQFRYNNDNLLASVVSTRTNICLELEVVKTYTFNYNQDGLLKSVLMNSETALEQNYFGYYPNGKVKEIYYNYQRRNIAPQFTHQTFYYDPSYSNVIKIEEKIDANPSYTYKYFYDNNINPYKGFFTASSVLMPHVGPAYLSTNNVIKIIKKKEQSVPSNIDTSEYLFNYSPSNELELYLDKDQIEPYTTYLIN